MCIRDSNYTVLGSSTASPASFNNGVNADYEALSGSVVVMPGNSGADIVVNVFNDFAFATNESDETVDLRLDDTDNTDVSLHAMDEASVTITDDDGIVVSIVASDSMAREGNDDGEFTILLSGPSDAPVVVDLGVLLGNGPNADATDGSDYALSNTQVTFAPFQTSATVDLNVINDAVLEEFIEQAEVEVDSIAASNTGVSINPTSAIVDIKPDPTVQIQAFDNMGMEGADDASFIVHLPFVQNNGGPVPDGSSPLGSEFNLADGDLTVTYEVRGDAVNGTDYATLTGTVVIPAGQGYAFIDVDVTDDNIIEDLENVVIVVKEVSAADPNDGDVAVRQDLYSIDPDSPTLRIVNTDVSDGITDGSTDSTITITFADGGSVDSGVGLATDPTTHELYAVLDTGSDLELAIVDPATGIATRVGVLSDDFVDITFDSSGVLYGLTSGAATNPDSLFEIDPANASSTLISSTSGATSIDFNELEGNLFLGSAALESLDLAGAPDTSFAITGDPAGDLVSLEHVERGNFAGDAFFATDVNGDFFKVTLSFPVSGPLATFELIGSLDHDAEGLAFFKSTDFVTIKDNDCLLYTSPSPRDRTRSRMPSSA